MLRAYTAIFIFERSRQELYEYEILGEQPVLDRPAVKISFRPRPPAIEDVNDWYGTAWVDRETFLPLLFEARKHEDYLKKKSFEESLGSSSEPPRDSPVIKEMRAEFRFEQRGLRFPSEVLTRGTFLRARRGSTDYRERPVFDVLQSYANYRFYEVHTAEEIGTEP